MSPQLAQHAERWLSVDDLISLLATSRRTVQRRAADWFAAQWPRTRRVPQPHGHFAYEVHAEDFDAYCAGEDAPQRTSPQR